MVVGSDTPVGDVGITNLGSNFRGLPGVGDAPGISLPNPDFNEVHDQIAEPMPNVNLGDVEVPDPNDGLGWFPDTGPVVPEGPVLPEDGPWFPGLDSAAGGVGDGIDDTFGGIGDVIKDGGDFVFGGLNDAYDNTVGAIGRGTGKIVGAGFEQMNKMMLMFLGFGALLLIGVIFI